MGNECPTFADLINAQRALERARNSMTASTFCGRARIDEAADEVARIRKAMASHPIEESPAKIAQKARDRERNSIAAYLRSLAPGEAFGPYLETAADLIEAGYHHGLGGSNAEA